MSARDELDALKQRLDAHRPLTPDRAGVLRSWLVPHAVYSAYAFGRRDVPTRAETQVFFERRVVSSGYTLDVFLGLARHFKAFEYVEEQAQAGARISTDLVKEVHRLLASGANEEEALPGEWKRRESALTRRRGKVLRYADPAEAAALMHQLVEEFREVREERHPVGAATWLYYHLDRIHPFEQLNGVVARLVASCVLLHHGYPPLVLDPREVGTYLDALSACENTAPPGFREPLSVRIDVAPLRSVFLEALTTTATRMLAVLDGQAVQTPEEVSLQAHDAQEELMALMKDDPRGTWRLPASFQVRELHRRLEDLLRRVRCEGRLYTIGVREALLCETRALPPEVQASMPAGDSGLAGYVQLVLEGDPAVRGVRFPEPLVLDVGVASSQSSLVLVLKWSDERKPAVQLGPAQASNWSDAELNRQITRTVNQRRKRFEYFLAEENLSREVRAQIQAFAKQDVEIVEGSEESEGEEPEQPEEAEGLRGLAPIEPPIEF